MLQKFYNKFYGDYKCSGSGKVLVGYCPCVGDDSDDEGYHWRSFDPDFWAKNIENKLTLDQVYSQYPVAPIND